ncbi:MAG: uridylate kinase [Halobacteriales archaeon]|jgi:uridylate kinase
MNVVVSIGGSVLATDLAADEDLAASQVAEHASIVDDLATDGHDLGVVVGGGPVSREYIGTARDLGANEIELDRIGIDVTRLNARLLIAALESDAVVAPPADYEAAGAAIQRSDVCVMGGVTPAQTTDAVSAALAEYVEADLLVYATSVPGVFSADPNEDADAERYERLTPGELVDVIAGMEMNAGSPAPVDLLAAKVIERAGIRTVVLDGTDPERIAAAVQRGEYDGTDVIPDGTPEPPGWGR